MNSNEAEKVKRQLINNIESSFPKDKADILKRQIMSMGDEQLASFLEKSGAGSRGADDGNECIFCSIASGKRERFEVGESDSAIAVLDINPASKGHVLIIPREHIPVDSFTAEIKKFAGEIADKIKEKLNPKDIEISSQDFGGHGIMNLVPVYTDESINSDRHGATKESLKEIADILIKKNLTEYEKKDGAVGQVEKKAKKPRVEKISWLPKRIP